MINIYFLILHITFHSVSLFTCFLARAHMLNVGEISSFDFSPVSCIAFYRWNTLKLFMIFISNFPLISASVRCMYHLFEHD